MKTALAAVLTLTLALGIGDTAPEAAAAADATSCLPYTGDSPALGPEQVAYVRRITAIGRQRGVRPRGWAVAIATAMQESTLANLPGGDRDSVGLFQQRASQGWGTVTQLTTVDYAINAFYGGPTPPGNPGLLDVAGWEQLPLTDAAQAVQRSGYPDAYARWTALAIDQVRAVTGVELDCAKVTTGTAAAAPRNPDGSWPAEACTVRPDPSTGTDCLTPRTAGVYAAARAAGYTRHTACFRPATWGEHPEGRACDLSSDVDGFGGPATGDSRAYGDQLAAWAVANADRLGVMYVIWYRRIWTPQRGWHPYSHPRGSSGPGAEHTNHVHISMH